MYKRARWFHPRSLEVDRSTDLPVSSECHCFGASFTRNWIKKKVIKRLGVSRTSIREALLSLEDEGQVQIFSQSGTHVWKIRSKQFLKVNSSVKH